MEKLPQTSQRRRRSDFEVSQMSLAAVTDRKIRNIIETRRTGSFFEQTYIHLPEEKLQLSDTAEVSSQLSTLRNLMDKERFSFTRGDRRLKGLQSESVKVEEVIDKRKSILNNLKIKVQEVEDEIKNIIDLQGMEEGNLTIYLHVLDRMRTTLVFLKRKYRKNENSLHSQSFNLEQVLIKSVGTKKKKYEKFHALMLVRQSAEFEKSTHLKEVESMNRNVKKREEMSAKRLQHKLKQEEMTEQAVIEDQSAQMEGMREKYLLHFMWHMLSTFRFQKEQGKWKRFEDAFMKIKLATGIQDILLLVEKYLTKEQIYSDFLSSVKTKELALEEFKDKIEEMQKNIDRLNEPDYYIDGFIDKSKYAELEGARKELMKEDTKLRYLKITQNKIKNWCFRYNNKITVVGGERCELSKEDFEKNNLRECIEVLKGNIVSTIRHLKVRREINLGIEIALKRQNLAKVIERIPMQNRLKSKVSDLVELSELIHAEPEDFLRKNK